MMFPGCGTLTSAARTCAVTLARMLLELGSVSTGNALPHTIHHIRGVSLEADRIRFGSP